MKGVDFDAVGRAMSDDAFMDEAARTSAIAHENWLLENGYKDPEPVPETEEKIFERRMKNLEKKQVDSGLECIT